MRSDQRLNAIEVNRRYLVAISVGCCAFDVSRFDRKQTSNAQRRMSNLADTAAATEIMHE
jgi:hypothetical protein